MRLGGYFYLLRLNLTQSPGRTFLMALAMAGAGFFLALVAATVVGLPGAVFQQIERAFPERRMLVKPKGMDIALVRIDAGIAPEALEELRELSGVEAAHPIEPLRVPSSITGDILDLSLQTDVIVWGVPRELIDLQVGRIERFGPVNWRRGEILPVVVPSFYLDMYNTGLAAASGLPQISPSAAVGRELELLLGTSTIGVNVAGKRERVAGEVIGLTANAQLLGVLLPFETVGEMNRWWQGPAYVERYVGVVLELDSLDAYDDVASAVERLGLAIQGNREVVATVRYLTLGGAGLVGALGLIVAAMGLLNLVNAFGLLMHARRDETCLFLAVGGTRPRLMALYLAEAGLLAFAGGLAGALTGWGGLALAELIVRDLLPELTFLPERLLWLSPAMPLSVAAALGMLGVAVVAPIVWRQASRPPAMLLSELE